MVLYCAVDVSVMEVLRGGTWLAACWEMKIPMFNSSRFKNIIRGIVLLVIKMTHILLHFLVPILVAVLAFRKNMAQAVVIMWLTMLVDLDHLWAIPIYAPLRCSIGFHPLHELWVIGLYFLFLFWKPSRLIGLGLIIHMVLDGFDCYHNTGMWMT